MALPAGYTPIDWSQVSNGDQIYILEDGRTIPYGPYPVVDATNRMVQEAHDPKPWQIRPSEIIGIPDATTQASVQAPVPAYNPYPSAERYLEMHANYIAFFLASKNPGISPATQAKVEAQAEAAKKDAAMALVELIRRVST